MKTRRKSLLKRGLSFFIAVTMCLSMLQMPIFAAEEKLSEGSSIVEVSAEQSSSEDSSSEDKSSENSSSEEKSPETGSDKNDSAEAGAEGDESAEEGSKGDEVSGEVSDGKGSDGEIADQEDSAEDTSDKDDSVNDTVGGEEVADTEEEKDTAQDTKDENASPEEEKKPSEDNVENPSDNKETVANPSDGEKPKEETTDKEETSGEVSKEEDSAGDVLDKDKAEETSGKENSTAKEENKEELPAVNSGNEETAEEKPAQENLTATVKENSEQKNDSKGIPAAVKKFLDAVAAIPKITPDNAEEVAEYLYGEVSDAYEELLGTEDEDREDVQDAVAVMEEAMAAVDAALEMDSEGFQGNRPEDIKIVTINQFNERLEDLYPGSIEKKVGETITYNYCPTDPGYCGYCNNLLVETVPDYYAFRDPVSKQTVKNIVDYTGYTKEYYPGTNYPGLKFMHKAIKPGNTKINLAVYHRYEAYYERGNCNRCGAPVTVYNDEYYYGNPHWYGRYIYINAKVNADYRLEYNLNQGSGVVNPTAKTIDKTEVVLDVTTNKPTRSGYTFLGWATSLENANAAKPIVEYYGGAADPKKNQTAGKVTLKWDEGQTDANGNLPGSQINPITKILYAVWEDDGTTPVDPTAPEAPERTELYSILRNFVKVKCVSVGEDLPHNEKTYATWDRQVDGKYESEVGTPYSEDGTWKVDVTLYGNVYAAMYSMEPVFGVGEKHQLAENESLTKTITLTWDTDSEKWTSGSNKNTVLATFEVVCKAEPVTYTVTYTDGVPDLIIFPDESYEGLKEGEDTPPFEGEINREGFTFKGWELNDTLLTPPGTVKPTVAKGDANQNNEIIYIAVWEDNSSSQTPGIDDIKITKSADPESVFIGDEVKFTIKVENRASQGVVVKVEDVLPKGLTFEKTEDNEGGRYDKTSHTVTWDNISVPPKGSTDLYVWVKAEKEGSFVNQAKVFLGENSREDTASVEVKKPEDPKNPKLVVTKENDGFKIDEKTGNAFVDYTVTITNKSGFPIYGLRLTDTLEPPTLEKVNESDIGEPNVQLTFKNFKKDVKSNNNFTDIKPEAGEENDLVHVMQLLSRNEVFEDEQTVTLTYTIEIVNLNEDVEVKVKLDNTAKGESWSKLKDSSSARMLRSAVSSSAGNDEPDISDSASSSASGSSGSSSAGGILPRKYSVTYRWDNLPEGANEVLPGGAKYFPKNTVVVDDHYQKDTEIEVEGKIYTFSGWSTGDAVIEEGSFTMPAKNVVIHGRWKEKKEETPDVPDKPDPTPTPGPSENRADYTVEWYDADSNEQIKESETRSGTEDSTVSVRESDKEIAGYTFVEDHGNNVLSAVVAEDGSTVLKLYFTKNSAPTEPDPEPERKDTVYTVIHTYYTNEVKSGENVQTITGKKVGDTVSAADIGRNTTYNGNTYSFTLANPDSLVLEEDGDKNVITLRYDRTTSTSSSSRPSSSGGGGGGGGSSTTNLSGRVHGTTPNPESAIPGDNVPLADIPEGTDIPDEDVPLAGIPMADIPDADVPLAGFPGLTGIPDEDVPLASVPKTGDSSGLWHMMALLSAFSLMAVSVLDKKKRQEKKQEN